MKVKLVLKIIPITNTIKFRAKHKTNKRAKV